MTRIEGGEPSSTHRGTWEPTTAVAGLRGRGGRAGVCWGVGGGRGEEEGGGGARASEGVKGATEERGGV